MNAFFDAAATFAQTTWLKVLLDAFLKGALLLMTAWILSLLLRRAAAATRHLIWSLALIGVLALPVLSFILPSWNLPLAPAIVPSSQKFENSPSPLPDYQLRQSTPQKFYYPPAHDEQMLTVSTGYQSQLNSVSKTPVKSNWLAALSSWTWPTWILLIWLSGVMLVSARWLLGWLSVKWLSRRSQEIFDDEWNALSESLSAELGLRQPVKLLRAETTTAPMTWGFFRPVILLPDNAETWPAERRRVVLLHELAHIKRGDLLSQLVAQIACAFYWFNPFTWLAARRLRIEREQACDDAVLNTGAKASDYANHILEILRSLRFAKCSPSMAVAMAPCSQLESRLRAILNPNLCRGALTTKGEMLLGAAVACVVLPVAAISPWANFEKTPTQSGAKLVLSDSQFQLMNPKLDLRTGAALNPIFIAPWQAGADETTATSSEDCNEEKHDASIGLRLDRLAKNSASLVGQNLVEAMRALGIENIAGQNLIQKTSQELGDLFAAKLRESGYDELSIHELVQRVNEGFDESFAQDVKKSGYPNLTVEQLLQMRIHGIDAEYIKAMKEAGFDDLSVEELLQLRIQGVDPEYVKEMKAAGFAQLDADELLQMRIHGVDADYARELNAAGFGELAIERLLQLRIHGVDADYAKEMKAAYGDLSLEELLQLRIQGVDTDYAKEMKAAGFGDLPINDLLQMRIQGVDAEYAKAMRAAYPDLSTNDLLQLRIQGVDADFAKGMKAAGFGDLSINDLLQLRIQGVDADYAKAMKAAGFAGLSTNQLLQLRIQGVDADYVKEMKAVGYNNLSTEQILQMRIQGVDADFVKELQKAGLKNLSPEKLIQLKIHGFDAGFFRER